MTITSLVFGYLFGGDFTETSGGSPACTSIPVLTATLDDLLLSIVETASANSYVVPCGSIPLPIVMVDVPVLDRPPCPAVPLANKEATLEGQLEQDHV